MLAWPLIRLQLRYSTLALATMPSSLPSSLASQLVADLGISARDRITSNRRLRVSGVRAGAQYQISTDFGKTWGALQSAPLPRSGALLLDGQNDFVAIPDSGALPSGNGSYTLEAWIKPDVMGDRGIIGWGPWGSQSQVNALRLMGNGQIRHYWWSNDLDVNVGNLADGQWHHVAATFDGKTRKVYVDGVLKGSDVPPAHRLPVVAKNIRIGSTNNGEYFKGGIDDAAIWRRALSQEEISKRLTTKPDASDKDLVVLYSFDEGTGTVVTPVGSGATGLAGTLTNGPTWTTREVPVANAAVTVDLELEIPDGKYAAGQLLFRDLTAQETLEVEAFQVDTKAPTVTLNVPGGADGIISSQAGDNIISGTAEAGRKLTLLSKLGTVQAGNLKITADNGADIYLNGQLVGSTSDWTRPYDFTGLKIQAGKNVLAVLAYDVGGIAGLSGRFEVPSGTFGTSNLGSWKVLNVDPESTTDNSAASRDRNQWKLPSDWNSVNFDDRTWSAAINVQAKTGQYPWGNRTGDPAWIWSSDPYNHDAVLFRYTFDGTNDDVGQVVLADNIEVGTDGKFSYQLSAEQLKQLGEGSSKTLVAVQTDEAGNLGRSSTATFAVDTVGFPVSITSIGGGDGKVSNETVEIGRGPLRFQVDQYTGYWNSNLNELRNYVKNYNPATQKNRYSVVTDVIDFTDDQGGFAGELPFDRRWPAAEATNYWGTGGINNQFFVRVSGDFFLDQPGQYRFRTFNDDGVFLLIDGNLVINDPTLHPERVFTGDANLAAGNHQIELFFFENGGEASLEFSVSRFDPVKKVWGPYQLMGKDSAFQAKSVQETDNLVRGQGEPNSTVFFRIGDVELGSAKTDSSGAFTYALTPANLALLAQMRSDSQLIAYQRDSAGNLSSSAPGSVTLKEKPPVVTIENVGLQDKTVSTLAGDNIVIGLGEANLMTTLRAGSVVLGQVKADVNGRFRYTLTPENINILGQGSGKSIIAAQSLPSGLLGESASFAFGIDTLAPDVAITSVGYGDTRMSRNSVELGKGALQFRVDQYTGYWSRNLNDLRNYIAQFGPTTSKGTRYSVVTDVIDFTDDQGGFAGELPYDMRWPAAAATNFWGTGGINNQFFVKISSGFSVDQAGLYRFRTYNDDGVFLMVDGASIISDPTEHPEAVFTGDVQLAAGNHSLELFFFENAGEASLEFSVSYFNPVTKQWGAYQLVGQKSEIKALSNLQPDNLIEGTADPGGEVVVYLGSTELGRTRANQQGLFGLNLSSTVLEALDKASSSGKANVNLQAIQLDAAGNVGTSTPTIASVKLTPPVITLNRLGGADGVVSSEATDRLITGTAEAGLELTIAFNGSVIASLGSVAEDGNFSYTLTDKDIALIGQGKDKVLQLRQQDLYGNVGTLASPLFAVDTIAPDLVLPPAKDPTALGGIDGIISTQVGDAILVGVGEANTTVSLIIGSVVRSVMADTNGRFRISFGDQDIAALGQGAARSFAISQSDAAGNTAMKTIRVDVDTIPPDKPVMQSLAGDGYLSGRANDNVIAGRADADSIVTLLLSGATLATVKTDKNGLFNYSLSQADIARFGQGEFQFQARLADLAGNIATSDPQQFVIDTIAPQRPALTSVGGSDLTISTKDNQVVGSAEAMSLVSLYYGDKLLGSTLTDNYGAFNYSISAANVVVIGQGAGKKLQALSADRAGNVSLASEVYTFNVDTVAPTSPSIRSIGGTDGVISSLAGDSTMIGFAEAGSELVIRGAHAKGGLFEVTGITADSRGNWSYALTTAQLALLDAALSAGSAPSLQALCSDKAGNEGKSLSITPTIDLKAPDLKNFQVGGADGVVSTVLNDNRITGMAEANRAVVIHYSGSILSTAIANSGGLFSYNLSSSDLARIGQGPNKQLQFTQSDLAGNTSEAAMSFAVDTIAPALSTIESLGGFDKIVTSALSDRTVRGSAEVGSTIVLQSVAGTVRTPLATLTVDQTGKYGYALTSQNLAAIAKGVGKKLEIVTTDAAGNFSTSRIFDFSVEAQWSTGTASNDVLPFSSGIDALTGLAGADRFALTSLGSAVAAGSTLLSFDRIIDFQIGVDQIDAPVAVASRSIANLGNIQALTPTHLASMLTANTFVANGAAVFTYQDMNDGVRTFLAINDRQAGFARATDGVVEITGYMGVLSQLSIV